MYLSQDSFHTHPSLRSFLPSQVESLLEQGSNEINEDVVLAEDNIFGVFDGATSLGERSAEMKKAGGFVAATLAADTFRQTKPQKSLLDQALVANRSLGAMQDETNFTENKRYNLWSTSIAVVRLQQDRLEFCQTGDSLIAILYDDGSYSFPVPEVDIDRETLALWKRRSNEESGRIHTLLADQILKVRKKMNREYGVLNGEPRAAEFIRHGFCSLDGVRNVLLFTDGLFPPKEDPLEKTDWDSFVGLFREGGLQALRNHVRTLQATDPFLRKYPRFKCHDDIGAVALSFA
ncbi:protein phosphatase 2C domain-containing protein [Desulforhopalus singaporensis]|uniref:Protein phosphatase 2C n=1 Tax=Desulforhopalus singaporensis TaxID=91360 RepID=A0A1H0S8U7_9BACT|nr:protein phosphatase 2C domain-containing protein [Desulforhopalus singaporensis]SDP37638.1 Protein phosphatase 2C [Desulforhopalus singaporensis]